MPANLPFSEACERNKGPILEVLRSVLTGPAQVLEIGSGTGQHGVHFARHLPHVVWQPSDRLEHLAALNDRIRAEGSSNLLPPIALDVTQTAWPAWKFDAVYSANTLHIMSWDEVLSFYVGVGSILSVGGTLVVYGPFRYAGRFTTASNAAFDQSLRERDPCSGIRDFEAVDALAAAQGLELLADHALPANNQLLVWARVRGR